MKKSLLSLLLLSLSVSAAQPFTPEQETRIKELIKETLVQNPSILAEAADAYNKQEADAQQQVVKQIIAQNKEALFADPGSPRLGAKEAKLTLVLFTDYNCPYCKQFDPFMERIVKDHPDVAVVFKFLPYRAESSLTSARDALTLWETHPEQFWKLNTILMAKKSYHDNASIDAAKQKAGVTIKSPSKQSLETVNTSLALANKLGIQGTPAILIGDHLLSGYVPYEQFNQLVTAALAETK